MLICAKTQAVFFFGVTAVTRRRERPERVEWMVRSPMRGRRRERAYSSAFASKLFVSAQRARQAIQ